MRPAAGHHAAIELMDLFRGPSAGDRDRDEEVQRSASHRCDVAEVGGRRAKADIWERGGVQIEMDRLDE